MQGECNYIIILKNRAKTIFQQIDKVKYIFKQLSSNYYVILKYRLKIRERRKYVVEANIALETSFREIKDHLDDLHDSNSHVQEITILCGFALALLSFNNWNRSVVQGSAMLIVGFIVILLGFFMMNYYRKCNSDMKDLESLLISSTSGKPDLTYGNMNQIEEYMKSGMICIRLVYGARLINSILAGIIIISILMIL